MASMWRSCSIEHISFANFSNSKFNIEWRERVFQSSFIKVTNIFIVSLEINKIDFRSSKPLKHWGCKNQARVVRRRISIPKIDSKHQFTETSFSRKSSCLFSLEERKLKNQLFLSTQRKAAKTVCQTKFLLPR